MVRNAGFTLLEFMLVSVLAASLLTTVLPLLSSFKSFGMHEIQLSSLQTRAQLMYNILSAAVRSSGGYACVEQPAGASLAVAGRELIHDTSVSAQNNILLLSGCTDYNSAQHMLQTAYFIAKSTVSKQPALYSKILAIDGMSVSLPKVELVSSIKELKFSAYTICAQSWCAAQSGTVAVVDAILYGGNSANKAAFVDSKLPLGLDSTGQFILRASWDLRAGLV